MSDGKLVGTFEFFECDDWDTTVVRYYQFEQLSPWPFWRDEYYKVIYHCKENGVVFATTWEKHLQNREVRICDLIEEAIGLK